MEAQKPVGNQGQRTIMIPQMAGNIPLASLMQQMPPAYYANGFEIALSGADVCITLSQNNRQLGTVNLSFIATKTLAGALSGLIKDLEEKGGMKIPSIDEMARAMQITKP